MIGVVKYYGNGLLDGFSYELSFLLSLELFIILLVERLGRKFIKVYFWLIFNIYLCFRYWVRFVVDLLFRCWFFFLDVYRLVMVRYGYK